MEEQQVSGLVVCGAWQSHLLPAVTLVSGAIIVILFLSELAYFLSTDVSASGHTHTHSILAPTLHRFGRSSM